MAKSKYVLGKDIDLDKEVIRDAKVSGSPASVRKK